MRCVVCLILSCFLAVAASADAPEPIDEGRRNSLSPGAWAIQFQIEDDIGLKPFNGMSISLKRHISSRSAFRLGATLGLQFDDMELGTSNFTADTLASSDSRETDSNSQSIRIDLLYMQYPTAGKNVHFFWGAGPLVRFSRSDRDEEIRYTYLNGVRVDTVDQHSDLWGLGGMGTVGVEWFATKDVSFHAEYFASLEYTSTDADYTQKRSAVGDIPPARKTSDSSVDQWEFDGVNVILGISIYF